MQKIENVTFDSYFYKKYPDLIKKKQKKKEQESVEDSDSEEVPNDGKRLIGRA